jgi:glutathione-regulated potassium-efflux system ancillary protein KefG
MKVLVLFAHPALEKSRINRRLLQVARDTRGVTVQDLYEVYPDLNIDVEREQQLLAAHDAVVFQHPFYWYSTPAILKQWQDLVLELGWAYGKNGTALRDKLTFNAVSAGGPEVAYHRGGYNVFTVRELLAPWEATARLCHMRYLPPFVVFGALRFSGMAEIEPHALAYQRLLRALVDDRLDLVRAAALDHMTHPIEGLITGIGAELVATEGPKMKLEEEV